MTLNFIKSRHSDRSTQRVLGGARKRESQKITLLPQKIPACAGMTGLSKYHCCQYPYSLFQDIRAQCFGNAISNIGWHACFIGKLFPS